VGVIGLGVGEKHAEGYEATGRARVTAVCDFDPDALARPRWADVRRYGDAFELIADDEVDVVSIASYDSHHYAQVVAALEAGRHVFVEKPLCTTSEEAEHLHALRAAHPGLRMSSNLPLRLSPRFIDLKARIDAGELGRLYHCELDYDYGRLWKITEGWRGRELDYSPMLGGGVHMVDLLLWLTGSRVRRVSAVAGNRIAGGLGFDDLVVALLEMEDGAVAKVGANFGCVHPHFHAVKLYGTEGTFINGLPDATLWTGDRRDPQAERIDTPYPGVHKGDLIHSFAEAILRGTPADVTEAEVFHTLDVLFAIERAHRTKAPTSLNAR
jgi:predicted dehydrogenase